MITLERTNTEPTQSTPVQASVQVKTHKPDSDDSPVKGVLTNFSGDHDISGHYDKQCTDTGEQLRSGHSMWSLWSVGAHCM